MYQKETTKNIFSYLMLKTHLTQVVLVTFNPTHLIVTQIKWGHTFCGLKSNEVILFVSLI